ncbi:hypothetical protein IT403_01075 [Candidatus Nomurabacteria bacterium]|nr:hypothetical protein [Candidatus Nomurabacteria bacterium]
MIFKISTSLKAPVAAVVPYVRYYKMTWNMFGFSPTDANGIMSRPNPLSASGANGGVSLN